MPTEPVPVADDVVVPRTQVEQWIDMLDVVVSQTSGAARQASVQIQRQLKRLDKVVRGEIGGEEWTLPRRHNDGSPAGPVTDAPTSEPPDATGDAPGPAGAHRDGDGPVASTATADPHPTTP